ncbi:MAG TPA: hypothetical protein VNX70_02095 [Bryobacteraceae bacterium]|nr:hypothetical protein [Bryobacteraceae bacterium]
MLNLEAPPPDHRDLPLLGQNGCLAAGRLTTAPAIPAPGSMLELLPSRALSPAQVIVV